MKKLLSVLLLAVSACLLPAAETALDRYVQAPDPSYRYELLSTVPGQGFTSYVLELTSQTWRSKAEVDRPVWKHWLTIVRPDKVDSEIGLLYITGGNNDSKPPQKPDGMIIPIAMGTNSVVAELKMVPNQTLTFSDNRKPLTEDSFIAYTWDKFLRTGDETWPARLPMTKSAVRAMDAVTSFCAKLDGGGVKVSKFVVTGGSKRGWTTWTTAAVDKRVVAIVPIVIDVLNMEKSMEHHWRAYGFWAPSIKDYTNAKIMDWMGTPQNAALMKIEEPYSYRDRLTMPKLMMNASGDQFFLPDSSQFYFNDLKGEKHLRYVPNADHSMRGTDAVQTLGAFFDSIVHNTKRPEFSWTISKDGVFRVKSEVKPTEAKLWQATNPDARDFRMEKVGPIYKSTVLTEESKGVYIAKVPSPEKGWTAAFVELTFATGRSFPLKLTTEVKVFPNTYPFPAYKPEKVD
jgi:PhoPQ-activated pathogenicity-related protein